MLDVETRRRIDTARDILVGKVPDPKSQVEQITIALIYKFMDDIDAESEELGGRRTFFAGEFARYGWAKLMRSGLGGHETLNLYAEAIARMPENPGIPPLFRAIFNNAYLPYRDPETLRAFLKVIDDFVYDHSERLGDAFEYLLSVLGSQGDAGQFRTPRHIIDFMVSIVDPKKDEVVLDPACGTAGFLISSYKHILRANEDEQDEARSDPGQSGTFASGLTPEEKGRLAENFSGYDISPDMVRLSLVNLYLHGFVDPHIHEYDALTSEDRWNEYADVILANPPFMSPKGGIRPHNRFSVKSKRSEVLFVDYMAEHLNPSGRAGIIVPEGIIFQSQTAHRRLRTMLVEEYLVAVVSLPAGVFQPYSGVKTSILILDKALAKRTDRIAFFKVENDGFDLGAQRRPIDKNDLPEIAEGAREYLAAARAGVRLDGEDQPDDGTPAESAHPEEYPLRQVAEEATENRAGRTMDRLIEREAALVVARDEIAANGEYNLSGERYRRGGPQITKYIWQTIGALVEPITPVAKIQKSAFGSIGRYPIIDQSQEAISGWTDDESVLIRPDKPLVIFGDHTCAVKLVEAPFAQGADGIKILRTLDKLEPKFLYHVLRMRPLKSDGYRRHFTKLKQREIPLPPLEVQREIVAEIEGYQKVIDGARAVVDNYRPHIAIDPDWPEVVIGEIAVDIKAGFACGKSITGTAGVPHLRPMNITEDGALTWQGLKSIPEEDYQGREHYALRPGDILFNNTNSKELVGKTCWVTEEIRCGYSNHLTRVRVASGRCDPHFIALSLHAAWHRGAFLTRANKWIGQAGINVKSLAEFQIPLPALELQKKIVGEIEAEQGLVDGNRELIRRFEKKIQATIARVWGED